MSAFSEVETKALVSKETPPADGLSQATRRDVKVLSAFGGPYEIAKEQQDMMCLTSDGYLHVSEAHRASNLVMAFRERLNRNKVSHKFRVVRHSEIAALYKKFDAAIGTVDQASQRQAEVIKLMRDAVEMGSSDIHFRVEKEATRILFRVDGRLIEQPQLGLQHGQDLVATICQSMCDIAQNLYMPSKSQDARMSSAYTSALGLKGARIGTRPSDIGQLAVLRLLYQRKQKKTLSELGFFPEQEADIKQMKSRTDGITIVGGPTGSGKSTTLESLLSQFMQELKFEKNLITIEDPPEYEILGAVQTPVQYESNATDEEISSAWARSISNLMRLDPDLAMIGEMRDYASAIAAFRVAMTGHGVFTTLHANDVIATLVRLKDMGVDMSLITDPKIIIGMISQRLVPRVCEACRRKFTGFRNLVSDVVAQRIEKYCDPDAVYLAGPGCPECRGQGISGRIVIGETLVPTSGFMNEFLRGGQGPARRYWVRNMGGLTRNQSLIRRINEGVVDPSLGEIAVCTLDEDALTLE